MSPDGLDMLAISPWRTDAVALFDWLASSTWANPNHSPGAEPGVG